MDAQSNFDNQMELLGKVGELLENFTDGLEHLVAEGLTEGKLLPRRLQCRLTALATEALDLQGELLYPKDFLREKGEERALDMLDEVEREQP